MEAGPPDFGCFVQDLDEETLLAAARNEKGENELNEVGEAFDHQFSYQSQLGGAALSSSAPSGSFKFLLDPFLLLLSRTIKFFSVMACVGML